MIYEKFPINFELEEKTLASNFLFTYFWLTVSLLVRLFQIERKIHS